MQHRTFHWSRSEIPGLNYEIPRNIIKGRSQVSRVPNGIYKLVAGYVLTYVNIIIISIRGAPVRRMYGFSNILQPESRYLPSSSVTRSNAAFTQVRLRAA